MNGFNVLSLLAGGLEPAVAAYALRLNRVFGTQRAGWPVFLIFLFLALLHLVEPAKAAGGNPGVSTLVWLVVVLLLLIGTAHTDVFFSSQVQAEAHERALRDELRAEKAELAEANATLVRQLAQRQEREQKKTLRRADEHYQQQKMHVVARMAGGMAHHFNNLLTPIVGHTSLLLEQERESHIAEPLMEISKAANRAATLTRQLVVVSGHERIERDLLDLNVFLNHLRRALIRIVGNLVVVKLEFCPGLPLILADSLALKQVLVNLVFNARDAMQGSGTLTLSTSRVRVDDTHVQQPQAIGSRLGDFVCLTVKDSGCGMTADAQCHVFEPFFTTKDVGEGTGLGLATSYAMIKQHSGWIEVRSQESEGTEVKIFIPAAARQ